MEATTPEPKGPRMQEGKIHLRKRCPFCKGTVIVVERPQDKGPKLMHSKGAPCPKFGHIPDQAFYNLVARSRKERRAATSKAKGAISTKPYRKKQRRR